MNAPRHRIVKGLGTVLAACALAACDRPAPEPTAAPAPETPRHVVMICIDTVGAQSFFSSLIDDPLTPQLAAAQRYRNASSVAPWTIPSVATVFTGLYPAQHGAGEFPGMVANLEVELPSTLSESATTLAESLTAAGFRTAAFSSHPWLAADIGLDQGFGQVHSRKGWPRVLERFEQWLDQPAGDARRFGYLHFMEAHDWHLQGPDQLRERLDGVEPGLRALLVQDASTAACAEPDSDMCLRNLVYNLAVREQRAAIDAVLQSLAQRGLQDDTLVLVYSDHGEEFWQHKAQHEQRGDPRGIYGFGHGHSLYEELLHVPLLAWHPGLAGAAHSGLVSLVDVFPSVLAWMGVAPPAGDLPGRVLPTPPASGDRAEPRVIYASHIAYGPRAVAAREGSDKAILNLIDERFEYYDLAADPGEAEQLEHDRLTLRFDVLTGDYLELRGAYDADRPQIGSEQLEHLKSIGYLQGVDGSGTDEETQADEKIQADEEDGGEPKP